jgi:hypothetical protein
LLPANKVSAVWRGSGHACLSRCSPSNRSRSCLNFDRNSFSTSAVIPVA